MLFINNWTDRLLESLAEVLRELKEKFKKPELKPIPIKNKN
jgi:hypothetical protein